MYKDSILAQKLLIANLLGQSCVVFGHYFIATGPALRRLDLYPAEALPAYTIDILSVLFHGVGTVTFFLLAGFLFFRGFEDKGAWLRKVKNRLFTIGLPYIIWNFLASPWATALLIPIAALVVPTIGDARPATALEIFAGNPGGWFPANAPLWFLRELMLLAVLSPLLYRVICSRWYPVFACIVFAGWLHAAEFAFGAWEGVLQAAFSFTLGGWLFVSQRNPFAISRNVTILTALAAITLALIHASWPSLGAYELGPRCILGAMAIFGVSDILSHTRASATLAKFGKLAFGVYLCHAIGINLVIDTAFARLHPSGGGIVAVMILVPIVVICVIATTFVALRRFAPTLCYYLTGGRIRNR